MALPRLVWPLPALLCWLACWLLFRASLALGLPLALAWAAAIALGLAASLFAGPWWRRLLLALGFPLAMLLTGAGSLPGWAWLLLLGLLAALYPLQAWRDAPLFPTPADALLALASHAPLPAQAAVLDAGCGLGHGLAALRAAYPLARLHGIERSWPLRLLCGLRCPWALVRQGDLWRADWRPYALVYLFQRPESMPRALEKAAVELAPGSWLVSLEFEARDWQATHRLPLADGRALWLYRAPCVPAGATAAAGAARTPHGSNIRRR